MRGLQPCPNCLIFLKAAALQERTLGLGPVSSRIACAFRLCAGKEMCYLGWQESLVQLATLVEPEIPG